MTVLPAPSIPAATLKTIGINPPAGLVILNEPKRILPPAGEDGNGLPPDKITPYSGIYDEHGKLPTVPGPGMTFIAHV